MGVRCGRMRIQSLRRIDERLLEGCGGRTNRVHATRWHRWGRRWIWNVGASRRRIQRPRNAPDVCAAPRVHFGREAFRLWGKPVGEQLEEGCIVERLAEDRSALD